MALKVNNIRGGKIVSNYSSTKANGNVRYYTEKHLQDLDYEGTFPEHSLANMHYGHVAKNIHVYSGEKAFYMFAKTPQGYVYLGEGDCKPEVIGIPLMNQKFVRNPFYADLAKALFYNKNLELTPGILVTIRDIVDYVTEYYDIFQMVIADEAAEGRESGDTEPNFDMSKYIQTESGNALSANALPYTITLPYHGQKVTIQKGMVVIEAL